MRIDIITVLPRLLDSPFSHSILKRAQDKGLVEVVVHDLRDYSTNKQKSVDDYAYGGGAGMVLQIEPVARCIEALQAQRSYNEIIYMSPDGETLNQGMANELSLKQNLLVGAVIAQVMHHHLYQAFVLCSFEYGMGERTIEQAGKNRDDINPHHQAHYWDLDKHPATLQATACAVPFSHGLLLR